LRGHLGGFGELWRGPVTIGGNRWPKRLNVNDSVIGMGGFRTLEASGGIWAASGCIWAVSGARSGAETSGDNRWPKRSEFNDSIIINE